jgi:hypothetical protein
MQRIRSRGKGVSSSGTFPWRSWLIALGALCVFGAPGGASGAGPSSPSDQFQICPRPNTSDTEQYALCATAQCFFLNGVAYCNCDVMNGSSISIPFEFQGGGTSQNICDLLDDGVNNGFTVSTYSTPETLKKSYADAYSGVGPPPLALYTCPGGSSGAYAQCDGGVCFDSTTGNDFPGVGPIGAGQILCACPITEPRRTLPKHEARLGFQISGPWQKTDGTACKGSDSPDDCCSAGPEWPQGDWFSRFCFPTDTTLATGDIIPVGAPQGTPRLLSRLLDGSPLAVNECQVKKGKGPK